MAFLNIKLQPQQPTTERTLDLSMFPEGTVCCNPEGIAEYHDMNLRIPNSNIDISSRDIRFAFLANKDVNFISIRWMAPEDSQRPVSYHSAYYHRHHFNLDHAE